jgi:hypothetical protein
MPGIEWTMRQRKENDRKMEKWLEDRRTERIDEDGNPIGDYNNPSSST